MQYELEVMPVWDSELGMPEKVTVDIDADLAERIRQVSKTVESMGLSTARFPLPSAHWETEAENDMQFCRPRGSYCAVHEGGYFCFGGYMKETGRSFETEDIDVASMLREMRKEEAQ
ncbi:hypothetical protein [Thioalkalivibrio sp. ALE19]|uniref:hypothetical protein n=1 Tax=Thioalkalivibrio sp. ALE19 TaxID=1266909 RepID=UPI0004903CBD|nr:hypothetical protein [Thioalkalivibrio sp. ALE19]